MYTMFGALKFINRNNKDYEQIINIGSLSSNEGGVSTDHTHKTIKHCLCEGKQGKKWQNQEWVQEPVNKQRYMYSVTHVQVVYVT